MHAYDITERFDQYLKPWLTQDDRIVHPLAPEGGGGQGRFRQPGTLFADYDMFRSLAHPDSPSSRYLAQNTPSHPSNSASDATSTGPAAVAASPPAPPDINQAVLKAAKALVGRPKVVEKSRIVTTKKGAKLDVEAGDGQCSELPDKLLEDAGAQTVFDYNTLPLGAKDYVWGKKVDVNDAIPGDIIQFVKYEFHGTRSTSVTIKDQRTGVVLRGPTSKPDQPLDWTSHHHTAILSEKGPNDGQLKVIGQHIKNDANVREDIIESKDVTNRTTTTTRNDATPDFSGPIIIETTVTDNVKLKGELRYYRPQKK